MLLIEPVNHIEKFYCAFNQSEWTRENLQNREWQTNKLKILFIMDYKRRSILTRMSIIASTDRGPSRLNIEGYKCTLVAPL